MFAQPCLVDSDYRSYFVAHRTGLPDNDMYGSGSDSEYEDEVDEDSNGLSILCIRHAMLADSHLRQLKIGTRTITQTRSPLPLPKGKATAVARAAVRFFFLNLVASKKSTQALGFKLQMSSMRVPTLKTSSMIIRIASGSTVDIFILLLHFLLINRFLIFPRA